MVELLTPVVEVLTLPVLFCAISAFFAAHEKLVKANVEVVGLQALCFLAALIGKS